MPKKATEKPAGRSIRAGKGRGEAAKTTEKKTTRSRRGTRAEHETDVRQTQRTAMLAYDQIAQRAHEIWEQHGRPHGEDKQNWYEAEEQLKREMGNW